MRASDRPVEDARSSLEFWQRRHRSLPLYRVSARREAKVMAGRWQERVVDAELVRFERTIFGRVLKRMGVSRIWVQRGSVGRGLVFDLAWMIWLVIVAYQRPDAVRPVVTAPIAAS